MLFCHCPQRFFYMHTHTLYLYESWVCALCHYTSLCLSFCGSLTGLAWTCWYALHCIAHYRIEPPPPRRRYKWMHSERDHCIKKRYNFTSVFKYKLVFDHPHNPNIILHRMRNQNILEVVLFFVTCKNKLILGGGERKNFLALVNAILWYDVKWNPLVFRYSFND